MTQRLTIDELARRAGMTVRNVRAYQTRGLLPPPDLQGRTGVYSDEHLARLHLIKEMQAAGFNLAAISKLLETIPEGAGEEALRFERTLLSPWSDERPEVVTQEQLAARFGNPGAELFERAARAGIIRPLPGGRVELPVPSLVRVAEETVALGIPLADVLEVSDQLVANSNRVAAAFTELFLKNVWRPFEAAGRPPEKWPEVRAALERLRPLAGEALLGIFQARMARAVEEAFGSELAGAADDEEAAG